VRHDEGRWVDFSDRTLDTPDFQTGHQADSIEYKPFVLFTCFADEQLLLQFFSTTSAFRFTIW
jgi:hypothetical protein